MSCGVDLGVVSFAKKKDAHAYFAQIIERYKHLDEPLTGEELDAFLELFKRHPDYTEKSLGGVSEVYVRAMSGSYGFAVVTKTGRVSEVSYKKCILGRSRPHSQGVKQALRTAVYTDINRARVVLAQDVDFIFECPVTGDLCTIDEAEVDHEKIAFAKIVDIWARDRGHDLETLEMRPFQENTPGRLADDAIAEDFAKFHACVAHLRLVSKTGNMRAAKDIGDITPTLVKERFCA